MRKTISVFLTSVLFSLLLVVPVVANEVGITDFSVMTVVDGEDLKVDWWQGNDKYYLFLPSDANLTRLTVKYTASDKVLLDGRDLESGGNICLEANTEYELSCGGNTYILYPMKSDSLPSIHITTESGSMDAVHADKSHKESASIVISSGGEIILEKDLDYIKGRGNSTWGNPKKPYNIKFDKKTSLFGMDKAKKWTLLANYVDETLMRNHTALSLASELGIPFTSEHVYIDLYINGEYYGNYVLCESVEIGEGRVDINNLADATEEANDGIDIEECSLGGFHETDYTKLKADTQKWVDIPKNPEDITGGYLLEYEIPERYVTEVSGFVTKRNQTIVVKEPEYASEEQVKYISALYQGFEDAIYSENGYNEEGKHYSEYIDFDSIVKMYVFQEFTKNLDAGITSFYIYKDANNDKFVAAPIWDFDMALGKDRERYGMNIGSPDGWWAGVIYHWTDNDILNLPTMLNALYQKDDFFAAACDAWETKFVPILDDEYVAELSKLATTLTPSAVMNAIRWETYETTDYENTSQLYLAEVETNLLDFIVGRKAFLDKGLSDTSVRILFESNGGSGNMFSESAPQSGETFVVPPCTFEHSEYVFDSWNTVADGTGETYLPGTQIVLEEGKMTLYAIWANEASDVAEGELCEHMCHKSGFLGFVWQGVNMFNKFFGINEKCSCGVDHY